MNLYSHEVPDFLLPSRVNVKVDILLTPLSNTPPPLICSELFYSWHLMRCWELLLFGLLPVFNKHSVTQAKVLSPLVGSKAPILTRFTPFHSRYVLLLKEDASVTPPQTVKPIQLYDWIYRFALFNSVIHNSDQCCWTTLRRHHLLNQNDDRIVRGPPGGVETSHPPSLLHWYDMTSRRRCRLFCRAAPVKRKWECMKEH